MTLVLNTIRRCGCQLIILVTILAPRGSARAVVRGSVTKPTTTAHAMVVCAHPEAAKVGREILKKGGNAVDAAIAVQFALAVVYPNAGNIGGGGFLVWRSKNGEAMSLDFREKAPHRASTTMFQDSNGTVHSEWSLEGYLASGVPGTVAGMVTAHERLGSLPWTALLQPAISLARNGFRLTEMQAHELNAYAEEFTLWNGTECPLRKSRQWKKGDPLRQPQLALTLERIQRHGRDGFYAGETAHAITECMSSHGGLIDSLDLASYQAVWRPVVRGRFRSYSVISMPPPSSGGVALLQLLQMWETHTQTLPEFHSAAHVHLMAECERRVFADRSEWLGDPDVTKVPQAQLLDLEYLRQRMSSFDAHHASNSDSIGPGKMRGEEHEQTTHFSIVDAHGNAVALTTTLNDSYGSKIMVPGAGFLLNNEMDDFSAKPGVPNYYGLIGTHRNAVAANKRMLSSMTPTIIERNDSLIMVVGTPGGSTIISSVFQCIVNVIDYNMNMQSAVTSPRFHHQWRPDELVLEHALDTQQLRAELQSMGHTLKIRRAMGRVDAIRVLPDGHLEGGADPRGDDVADGF